MKGERELVRELEDFLLDKFTELFGLQSLALIENTGIYYVDYEDMSWVVTWHHGKGPEREAVGIVTIE